MAGQNNGSGGYGRGGQPSRNGGGQGARPNGGGLSQLHAAYNFVPLADWVHLCPWAEQVSHDMPFSDGLSGTIEYTLTNHTPLLVGRERDGSDVRFFRMEGDKGAYAIPGTSVRGMIRNVLEIAAFGRFRRVDGRALGVRDLVAAVKDDYQKRFATTHDDGAYKALAKSAWLWFREGKWQLEPCAHARVEHAMLDEFSGVNWGRNYSRYKWLKAQGNVTDAERRELGQLGKWRPNALEKYRDLEQKGVSLDVRFKVGPEESHSHDRKSLRYRKCLALAARNDANALSGAGVVQGRLVVTGQPGPNKHMEFVFAAPTGKAEKLRALDPALMSHFLEINGDSDEWVKRWRGKALAGDPVPVFYIVPKGKENDASASIDAIGLSQMFKLPYKLSLHDAIRNTSDAHLDGAQPDFVEAIFGYLDDDNGSLRSRVSFSVATASEAAPKLDRPRTLVLNNPKPSYFPTYIVQPEQGGKVTSDKYVTLMHDNARLRGWKRYPVRDGFEPDEATAEQKNVASTLHPLAPGARFLGRLRFHNLRPAELGALLWAMSWGGEGASRHALGMGKSCGFGQVSLSLGKCDVRAAGATAAVGVPDLMLAFAEHMEGAAKKAGKPGWENSLQLRELRAMADPKRATGVDLTHMHLDMRQNEFAEAKGDRRKGVPALALRSYSDLTRSAR